MVVVDVGRGLGLEEVGTEGVAWDFKASFLLGHAKDIAMWLPEQRRHFVVVEVQVRCVWPEAAHLEQIAVVEGQLGVVWSKR